MTWESTEAGYIAKILVPAGTQNVALGTPCCIMVAKAADVAAFKDYTGPSAAATAAPAAPAAPAATAAPAAASSSAPASAGKSAKSCKFEENCLARSERVSQGTCRSITYRAEYACLVANHGDWQARRMEEEARRQGQCGRLSDGCMYSFIC